MTDLIERVRAAGRAAGQTARKAVEDSATLATTLGRLKPRRDRRPTYAGIGSRLTPPAVLAQMEALAKTLGAQGWVLRSGGADGADTAFEAGSVPRQQEIYLPWPGYNGIAGPQAKTMAPAHEPQAMRIAEAHHPAWGRCGRGARKLHARNVGIILGHEVDDPVDAVVCWTPGGAVIGGTATGIRMAKALGRPVLNLAVDTPERVLEQLASVAKSRDAGGQG